MTPARGGCCNTRSRETRRPGTPQGGRSIGCQRLHASTRRLGLDETCSDFRLADSNIPRTSVESPRRHPPATTAGRVSSKAFQISDPAPPGRWSSYRTPREQATTRSTLDLPAVSATISPCSPATATKSDYRTATSPTWRSGWLCMETLSDIELYRDLEEEPDYPAGYLAEVPFLEHVPLQVQVDLLAETWNRHRQTELIEASLLDAAIVYAACRDCGPDHRRHAGSCSRLPSRRTSPAQDTHPPPCRSPPRRLVRRVLG